MGQFADKQRGIEKILHTMRIKTPGAIADPTEELKIKLFCGTHRMLCTNNKFFFDNWIILSEDEELIAALPFTREYAGIDANMIQMHVVPKIAKSLTDKFIEKYPNGFIAHITYIVAMPDFTYEIEYKKGLVNLKGN